MTILALDKVSLVGLSADKLQTLDALQSLGLLHIIPLREHRAGREEADAAAVQPELLQRALHYLLGCAHKRRQVTREERLDLYAVVHAVDHNRSERIRLEERRDFLNQRIQDVEPWGEFQFPPRDALAGQRLWFYLVPNYRMQDVQHCGLPWVCVHRDNRYSYVVLVCEQQPPANCMPVPRIRMGARPLSELREELEETLIALESVEAEREGLTRWIYLLQRSVASTEDSALLDVVAEQTLDSEEVFALQGWIARRDVDQLRQFAAQHGLVMLLEPPAPEELPPTRLQNSDTLGGGQEVVSFFQTPGYRSWDPSRVVFFSFVSFFAIIMSDAGYALALAGVVAWYWQRMAHSETGRRLRAMGAALAGASLLWGMLVGSYFGLPPPPALQGLKVLDLNDFDSMMRLSIVIGAAHLILGNLVMAWVRRHRLQAWSSVGWALAVAAALLGWLAGFGFWHWFAFGTGLLLVLGFSSEETGLSLRSLLSGLLALTNVTRIFGDVLSYLRLFALGLASASLAITFNQLAGDVAAALPGIGLLLQMLILLVGHLLNFVLTVASGVIHGLRLNLIEFYNWSLADEGYPFQPFAKREVLPWTT